MVNVRNLVYLKSFFKQITDSKIILDFNIVFLKPYNIYKFNYKIAQFPIMAKLTDM